VVVTIDAVLSQGLLGQLLCGLASGTGVTSLSFDLELRADRPLAAQGRQFTPERLARRGGDRDLVEDRALVVPTGDGGSVGSTWLL
jgi:hypothetical protein